MYFDRFDILEAYFLFACHWNGGQNDKIYDFFGRLAKLNFKPKPSLTEVSDLSDNGVEIYNSLVKKFNKG
jgi:hypothetical protein